MADSDFSQVFRDQESDEISLETSVPTDTLSPERDDRGRKVRLRRDDRISSSSANSKYILEKKQLLHDLQLYKIELSQRDIAIDNLKAQQMQKTDELEEKLNEALYQKQILQVRLESELRLQQVSRLKKIGYFFFFLIHVHVLIISRKLFYKLLGFGGAKFLRLCENGKPTSNSRIRSVMFTYA